MQNRRIATDVDDYLADVPADQRAALEKLRTAIRAAAPQATETISYGMPAYKYQGAQGPSCPLTTPTPL
jgi:uncharacterized protein YdhG (YjbR/CyaY superfamily)